MTGYGVSNGHAPLLPDACEILLQDRDFEEAEGDGVLLLADGAIYRGTLFGARAIGEGELVFTTGMTGYQESLTDPSFAGQILTFTYPMIGNYGIHYNRSESGGVWPRGVVVRSAMKQPDHRDSIASVGRFLAAFGVPGIENVDTRSITRRVRELGTVLCVFGPAEDEEELRERLAVLRSPELDDLVDLVSVNDAVILNPDACDEFGRLLPRIAVLDCGIKYNILRSLCRYFEVIWCPPNIAFESIEQLGAQALFCSNGPGDPAHPGMASQARDCLAEAIRKKLPVMGICLGHQLLGLSSGLPTYKMRYGHRGANQPVVDLQSGQVWITSQNHGFAVADPDAGMLAAHPLVVESQAVANLHGNEVIVRYINANDKTVEGLDVVGAPAFSVQFHPEACPGPHDAYALFARFKDMVESYIEGGV